MSESKEAFGAHVPQPVAADRNVDGEGCQYECDNDADYRIQVEGGVIFTCCQSCSVENRIYAKENELLDCGVQE